MKKAIIYGRTSTSKQSAESIETQIAECKKWAKENDCIIVDIYDDSGQSGRSYNVGNRSGFQQIKQDAKNGKMDYALIHKIDRFARSVADYFIQERELEKYGVKIIVVGMPFFQNADIITKSVHIAVAEQFSINLSNEVSTKMRTFAHKKAFLGGRPPYGYKVVGSDENKTLEINENEAQAIRLIFDLYLQGYGYINISKMLAQKGFLNKYGEPFTNTHVRTVLQNKKYNGWYVFGDMINRKGKLRKNPDRDSVIEIPNAHPKIIDDRTFNLVQQKIAKNGPRNKTKFRHYILTGKITCGCCGRAMAGGSTTKRDGDQTYFYVYYKCTGRKVNGCKIPSVRADNLEDAIARKIQDYVFDDQFVADLVKNIESNLYGDLNKLNTKRKNIEKALKEINDQIKAAMREKFSQKINEDLFEEVVKELNDEKEALENSLNDILLQINIDTKTSEIKDYVNTIRKDLTKAPHDVKSEIVGSMVQSIIVNKDSVDVYLYLNDPPGSNSKRYFSLPNVVYGVPLITLDKNIKVYTSEGQDLINFSLGSIKQLNNAK